MIIIKWYGNDINNDNSNNKDNNDNNYMIIIVLFHNNFSPSGEQPEHRKLAPEL